ncbi:MAG: hypothetical protein WC359_11875 [Dehalococcoidia bacterium]|jgi:hypothetical protein
MKDFFIWFCVVFIAVSACIVSYRCGFDAGQAACPVKYAVCENGTCVLTETPPLRYLSPYP